jgi:hypothetical protein
VAIASCARQYTSAAVYPGCEWTDDFPASTKPVYYLFTKHLRNSGVSLGEALSD